MLTFQWTNTELCDKIKARDAIIEFLHKKIKKLKDEKKDPTDQDEEDFNKNNSELNESKEENLNFDRSLKSNDELAEKPENGEEITKNLTSSHHSKERENVKTSHQELEKINPDVPTCTDQVKIFFLSSKNICTQEF